MIDSPTLAGYAGGTLSLLAIGAALYAGGRALRSWIVPEFSGAVARLAELVLALSLLVPTLELLGSLGLLNPVPVVLGCLLVGTGATVAGRRRRPEHVSPAPAPPVPVWALLLAVAVATVLVAVWSTPTLLNAREGMFTGDGTWYHMPFAAGFAQQHSTWALHFTDPMRLAAWFYPASSELLHSLGLVLFSSDWLSPFVNLGWLSLGLLGGYCVGRPYGAGPAAMVAVAVVLGSGILLESQAGEPGNDLMAIALLIAVAALLVNSRGAGEGQDPASPAFRRGPLLIAGLAAGLAISVKLTMLAPVGVITAGAIVLAGRGRRLRTAGLLLATEALTGGYWYLRNLLHTGNPVPEIGGLGPIRLPHPDQMAIYPREPHSVASYLFGHSGVFGTWIFPGLHDAFGPLFAVVLGLALLGALYAVLASGERALAILGAAALATAVVYILLPLSAAGPAGEPRGFYSNTRYLAPAIALGLVLVPVLPPLRRRIPAAAVLVVLTGVCAVSALAPSPWYPGHIGGTVLFVIALVWIPAAAMTLGRSVPLVRVLAIGAAVAALGIIVVTGRPEQVRYARDHYTEPFLSERARRDSIATFTWAQGLHDRRIALAGAGQLWFTQYLFYGRDASNRVSYIGQPGAHGQYRLAPSCEAFRRRINQGHYDFLVLTRWGDDEDNRKKFPIRAWVKRDPALRQISREDAHPQTVWVYRIAGRLDPRSCAPA